MENYVMVLDDSLFVASVAPVKLHAEVGVPALLPCLAFDIIELLVCVDVRTCQATKIKAPTRPSHELIAVSRSSGEGGGGGGDDDDSLDFDSDSDLDPPPPPPSVKPVEFDEEN